MYVSVTLRNAIILCATCKRTCTCASVACKQLSQGAYVYTTAYSYCRASFIKVFSPRGFTSRGVIVPGCSVALSCSEVCLIAQDTNYTTTACMRHSLLHWTELHLSIPLYSLIKLTPRQPSKAMHIIIGTGMLTLNRRNSLQEALHCVYVSLV